MPLGPDYKLCNMRRRTADRLPSDFGLLWITVVRLHLSFKYFFSHGARTATVNRKLLMVVRIRFTVSPSRRLGRPRFPFTPGADRVASME